MVLALLVLASAVVPLSAGRLSAGRNAERTEVRGASARAGDVAALQGSAAAETGSPTRMTYVVRLARGPGRDHDRSEQAYDHDQSREGGDVIPPAAGERPDQTGRSRFGALVESLQADGAVSSVRYLDRLGYAIVEAEPAALDALRMSDDVLDAWPDRAHSLPRDQGAAGWPVPAPGAGWNLERSGATDAWALGVIGEGTVVATLDSGALWSHPALQGAYRGKDGAHDHDWIDLADDVPARAPIDPNGHGTHVLGTIVGRSGDQTWGVAPGAKWIAARVFDGAGRSSDSRLLQGAEWLLAPTATDGSNPRADLAPDIINGSWTLESSADPLFSDILAAWRQAGIVAVFAAGNDDDGSGARATIRMPGAHADAIAVGALDSSGSAWRFSRGGPAFGGLLKPDLLAPGIDIVSADIRGGSVSRSGTSMSAPHVSGAAALVRSSRPELAPEAVAAFLRASAVDAGDVGPDMVYGWGALDAGAAVSAALSAGRVIGSVRRSDGRGVAWAIVSAVPSGPAGADAPSPWRAIAGADGRFALDLPMGRWVLDITAPRLEASRRVIDLDRRTTLPVDVVLEPTTVGRVVGSVRSAWWGRLGGARVEWPDTGGRGATSSTTDGAGEFALELPAGRRIVRVSAEAHRAITVGLDVRASDEIAFDVVLEPAPSILIVDADAHHDERIWPYIQRALADGGYDADVLTIDTVSAAVTAAELTPYDVVIWAHRDGSPGSIDRARGDRVVTEALTEYARRGGRLIVTGRSIGAWDAQDGPASNRFAPSLYRDILGARLMRIYSAPDEVIGLGPLAGLALDLRSPSGRISAERATGEWIAPTSGRPEGEIIPILRSGAEIYGVAIDDASGRRAYLAVGVEQAGGRSALRELFDRLLAWLDIPGVGFEGAAGPLAIGVPATVRIAVHAGRSPLTADLRVEVPAGLRPGPSLGGLKEEGGVLTWRGALGAGTSLRFDPEIMLDPDAGAVGGVRSITATFSTAGKVLTTTAAITITAPDLRESRLHVSPPRRRTAGVVELAAWLVNSGLAASSAVLRFDALPSDFVPERSSLAASGGSVAWEGDVATWSGVIESDAVVSVTLQGRLEPAAEAPSRFGATLRDALGASTALWTEARVGGPELELLEPVDGAGVLLTVGRSITLPISISNIGDMDTRARLHVALPSGVVIEPPIDTEIDIPAGVTRRVDARVVVGGDAVEGDGTIVIVVDDLVSPANPVRREVDVYVSAPDPTRSRLLFEPGAARGGSTVTGTLLVANHRPVISRFDVTTSFPPTIVIEPGSIRSSAGTFVPGASSIAWTVNVSQPLPYYQVLPADPWHPSDDPEPISGKDDPTTLRGPVPIGFAFPTFTDVVTRVWVSDTGLILFAPPETAIDPIGGLEGLDAPAIAVWWGRSTPGSTPHVTRSADRLVLDWPGAEPDGWSSVSLEAGGDVAMAWGPSAEVESAVIGVRQDNGVVVSAESDVLAGRSLRFRSPGGWETLTFRARLASTLALDTTLRPVTTLRWAGAERSILGEIRANPVRRDHSALTAFPATPVAGGRVRYTVSVGADGDFEPREFNVRFVPPAAGTIVSGPGRDSVWSERLGPGELRELAWDVDIRDGIALGAPLVARAIIGARGRADLELEVRSEVGRPARHVVELAVTPRMPWPGGAVGIVAGLSDRFGSSAPVDVVLSVPEGVVIDPASLSASGGAAPTWDPVGRRIHWAGEVGSDPWIHIRATGRFDGGPGARGTFFITSTDDRGGGASAWVDVYGAVARVRLPWVDSSRRPTLEFGAAARLLIGVTDGGSGASVSERP